MTPRAVIAGLGMLGVLGGFTKTQLHSRVTLFLNCPYLGNVAWSSFDQSDRDSQPGIIEDLGHADFLTNQPFQHNFSPDLR